MLYMKEYTIKCILLQISLKLFSLNLAKTWQYTQEIVKATTRYFVHQLHKISDILLLDQMK